MLVAGDDDAAGDGIMVVMQSRLVTMMEMEGYATKT